MGENGGVGKHEPAPVLPWDLTLNDSRTDFTPREGGGMIVHFTPAVPTPAGAAFVAPQVKIMFGDEGWKKFQKEVADDGVRSGIVQARIMPPDPAR